MVNSFLNLFIAKRISTSVKSRSEKIMVRIAILSVAVSVCVMILAVNILTGFKNQISDKVIGFASHYNVRSLTSRGAKPINFDQPFIDSLKNLPYIISISPYSVSTGVVKNSDEIHGILYKGVDSLYNLQFFENNLIDGVLPNLKSEGKSKEVIISNAIAKKMGLEVGDKAEVMFLGDAIYRDILKVSGIYETSLEEFDSKLILGDIRNVERLLDGAKEGKVSGFEIMTTSLDEVDKNIDQVEELVFNSGESGDYLMVVPVTEQYMEIFDWLNLQDVNLLVIIVIMISVSAFNIVAMMLIVLIDKSSMIGTLKALGMKNRDIHSIFLIRSSYIIGTGLFWGAFVGLALSYVQQYFKILKLSADGYFLSYVPVEINYLYICEILVVTYVSLLLFEAIPVRIISRISPHKSIKFN